MKWKPLNKIVMFYKDPTCGLLTTWFYKTITFPRNHRENKKIVYKEVMCWNFIVRTHSMASAKRKTIILASLRTAVVDILCWTRSLKDYKLKHIPLSSQNLIISLTTETTPENLLPLQQIYGASNMRNKWPNWFHIHAEAKGKIQKQTSLKLVTLADNCKNKLVFRDSLSMTWNNRLPIEWPDLRRASGKKQWYENGKSTEFPRSSSAGVIQAVCILSIHASFVNTRCHFTRICYNAISF
jgi:hypothetical protein